jgi:predicted amidophosphoribosyltransferase
VEKVDVCFLSVLPDAVQEGFAARLAGTQAHLGLQRRTGIQGSGTANAMIKCFGSEVKNIIFACIPASSAAKNEIRYKEFAAMVCRLTGAINAYDHIHVEGERLAVHEKFDQKKLQLVQVIEFDKEFFKGKKVLCFDDILTKGFSYARFALQLEKLGAEILGGFFIGKTQFQM